MIEFVYAKDLKKNFSVYGHFYCNDMGNDGRFACRSVLEIVSKNNSISKEDILNALPDAVVIMMNPGSSVPLEVKPCEVYSAATIKNLTPDYVDTKPDTTQYQIMRLMLLKKWKHVRVINLSDLRTPKSSELFKVLKSINNDQSSIFAKARKNELDTMLKRKVKAPIICAWGIDDNLVPMTQKAIQVLKGMNYIGVKDASTGRFLHASPQNHEQKLRWLFEIKKRLK
ncbi:MAG: DUF1643 domain-containing protein [Bacilli bacterium]